MVASLVAPVLAAERTAHAAYPGTTVVGTAATNGLSVPQSSSASLDGALAAIDPTTGSASASYPFALAQARGAVQPTLGLTYSSLSGDGDAGVGWKIQLHSIERRSPGGLVVPTWRDQPIGDQQDWDSYDTYVFDGKPLAPICMVRGSACDGISEALAALAGPGWVY